jgi:hypothetical protein
MSDVERAHTYKCACADCTAGYESSTRDVRTPMGEHRGASAEGREAARDERHSAESPMHCKATICKEISMR